MVIKSSPAKSTGSSASTTSSNSNKSDSHESKSPTSARMLHPFSAMSQLRMPVVLLIVFQLGRNFDLNIRLFNQTSLFVIIRGVFHLVDCKSFVLVPG